MQRLEVTLGEGLCAQALGLGDGACVLIRADGLEHDAEVARVLFGRGRCGDDARKLSGRGLAHERVRVLPPVRWATDSHTLPTSFLYMRTKRVLSQSRMLHTVSLSPASTSAVFTRSSTACLACRRSSAMIGSVGCANRAGIAIHSNGAVFFEFELQSRA